MEAGAGRGGEAVHFWMGRASLPSPRLSDSRWGPTRRRPLPFCPCYRSAAIPAYSGGLREVKIDGTCE